MNFFIKTKSNVSFSRHADFCAFGESTHFKICDLIIDMQNKNKNLVRY